jgi:hypothetical protein
MKDSIKWQVTEIFKEIKEIGNSNTKLKMKPGKPERTVRMG